MDKSEQKVAFITGQFFWRMSAQSYAAQSVGFSWQPVASVLLTEARNWTNDIRFTGWLVLTTALKHSKHAMHVLIAVYAMAQWPSVCSSISLSTEMDEHINRAHSFPRATEFQAELRNLTTAAEFPCFHGFSQNSAKFRGNMEIPRQRPNSVILYCCICNCDMQSLHRQLQGHTQVSQVMRRLVV